MTVWCVTTKLIFEKPAGTSTVCGVEATAESLVPSTTTVPFGPAGPMSETVAFTMVELPPTAWRGERVMVLTGFGRMLAPAAAEDPPMVAVTMTLLGLETARC